MFKKLFKSSKYSVEILSLPMTTILYSNVISFKLSIIKETGTLGLFSHSYGDLGKTGLHTDVSYTHLHEDISYTYLHADVSYTYLLVELCL